jgi:hypothetical protein
MYYEEELKDGILWCRTTPTGKWRQCSMETMSERIVRMKKEIHYLKLQIESNKEELDSLR